jgi:hypothetical protein
MKILIATLLRALSSSMSAADGGGEEHLAVRWHAMMAETPRSASFRALEYAATARIS